MRRHTFSFGRFVLGLIMVIPSFCILSQPYLYHRLGIRGVGLLLVGLLLLGLVLMILAFYAPRFFCADCGYHLGRHRESCPRCGCNLYTREFPGVGQTVKEGRKNF